MCIHGANPDRIAAEVMADILTPPPPVDYLAFAEAEIVFGSDSPVPGPYNRSLFPEFDEILRACSPDDPCRTVTISKSAQIGGTVLANIFTLGSMSMDPGYFLYIHPTDDNARRWSKSKLSKMLRATSSLTKAFPQRARDGSDSVMYKERTDGRGAIQISGANSPASLSMVSASRQVQDDLAKWEMNSAGDPESQADSRSRAFEFAKVLKISTPLIIPGCRITKSFKAGSQEKPFVPCPHCDAMQVLEWDNMLSTIEADPDDPHFTCIECGCEIREHHRAEMKKRLEWRAENEKAKPHHRSFWIWSAYSVLQSFARIVQEWLNAKGDPASERVFLNDTCGLAYETDGESPPWEVLRDRAANSDYPRGLIPHGGLLITLGVDCQGDRVEWQLLAWGRDNRRWIVEYGIFPGHIAEEKTRQMLDDLLEQTWPNAAGRRIQADMLAIDGNAWTEDVWAWARRHSSSRVIMVRGAPRDDAPLLARVKKERSEKSGRVLKYSRRFYNFGASTLKMALYRNLVKTDPLERAFVGLPKGLDDEFFRQLTAERRKAVKNRSGFTVYQWMKDPSQANEGLDTHLQAEAAAIRLGVRSMPDATWSAYEAERDTPAPDRQLDLEDLMMVTQPAVPVPPRGAPRSPPPGPPARPGPRPNRRVMGRI